ncbi:MAG: amylo-alpha-1,6-glucosidase [Chloroflexi bacterium]|nr:amylo-alpha-1,6-glucosidase [Chloroflexota bacterium]
MLDFGRDICSHLATAERREWLVTNSIGGYAMGTVANLPTRRYHGLLIAALQPPLGRTLLLSKLDETATYDGRAYPLFANRWAAPSPAGGGGLGRGLVEPTGFHHLERFHLEGTTPVWTFACSDALLEKRAWMQQDANTTYVRYDLRRATAPLTLSIKAIVNHRDHHGNTHTADWRTQVEPVAHGLRVTAFEGATPLYVLSDRAEATPQHEWYRNTFLSVEQYRGLDAPDDNLYAGLFTATLNEGESLTIVASTEPTPNLDGATAYTQRQTYEHQLLVGAGLAPARLVPAPGRPRGSPLPAPAQAMATARVAPTAIEHLVLAADQFIVRRALPDDPGGQTVVAGYPWFGDWGRDTMISLPGLTLVTGRYDVAARILRTFARFVERGMLPNRFPDQGERPEYNTVDATLWYVEAIRATHAAAGDDALLSDLFPVLQEIVEWHIRGTRYNIHLDPADGLLTAGEPGVQLTWMDAKVDGWVVTPRSGKPVEINALWYNALRSMADFARRLGQPTKRYDGLAEQARAGFARFWNDAVGYCYDVIDGPDGHDAALRPNQLLAVSLPHSPLDADQQRAVVDVCARHLLTSHGLRSLAPDHPEYIGHHGGDRRQRDAAYHQGTIWGWLIGPFVAAHLRVYGDRQRARAFLQPLIRHLASHGVGSISEIFDGDPPFTPRGCTAQAWSVAELLRAWQITRDADSRR